MAGLKELDSYLDDAGPAALVLRDALVTVEGHDGVLFPPTFASGDGFAGGYNIDGDVAGENICLIDSVGSQANRLEPLFAKSPYAELVPQIEIQAGERKINLLDAGHRAGDAIVRCSVLQDELQRAFKALLKGDARLLAKLAPTSLIFGVWDSRDTQAKAPRLVASTIRAFNVRKLTRSAQYIPAANYVDEGLLEEPADKATKDTYSGRGFTHVPATGSPGGVIAKGGIRRDATLSLAALRLLHAGDAEQTRILRRYILGLALVAFTADVTPYLRQGCTLVLDGDQKEPRTIKEVFPSGKREPFRQSHLDALAYAKEAAAAFGVGNSQTVEFDKERAKKELGEVEKKPKSDKKPKKGA